MSARQLGRGVEWDRSTPDILLAGRSVGRGIDGLGSTPRVCERMSLKTLSATGFRNLREVDLTPAPGVNVIFGDNGAGKTSLLEAIHFLGRTRSFRPTRPDQLVTNGVDELLVRGTVPWGDTDITAAVLRTEGRTRARVRGDDVHNLSQLAQYFPLQVINSESQRLLLDGPKVRRSFLNWGMFHVKHDYYPVWRRYDKALRQRNAALRSADARSARAWEPEMARAAGIMDEMRREGVAALEAQVRPILDRWLPEEQVEIRYRRGWSRERDLGEALHANRDRDLDLGYTIQGPHRADLFIRAGGVEAQHRLSRGQQKLVVIALLLGQAAVMAERSTTAPILLLDDLPAELDAIRSEFVMAWLTQLRVQAFITCIDPDSVPLGTAPVQRFHVEHGDYREVL